MFTEGTMMFKLLGFLLGSAVSVAAIVLLLGMPEFHLSTLADEDGRFDAAVEKLKEKQPAFEVEPIVEAPPVVAEIESAESTVQINENTDVADSAEREPDTYAEAEPPVTPFELPELDDALESADATPLVEIVNEASWYAFWNPFRSEVAARGFVAQLEKVTGLDYRIVKVKAGVYQVAFAYADDQERLARLSQIQAATGLDLSGS